MRLFPILNTRHRSVTFSRNSIIVEAVEVELLWSEKKRNGKRRQKNYNIAFIWIPFSSAAPLLCSSNSDFDENMWRKAKKNIAAIAGRLLQGSVLLSLVWFEAAAACCLCRVCISKTQALQQPRSEVISAVIVSATNYSVALALHIHTLECSTTRLVSSALERVEDIANFLSPSHAIMWSERELRSSRRWVFGHFVCDMNFSFDSLCLSMPKLDASNSRRRLSHSEWNQQSHTILLFEKCKNCPRSVSYNGTVESWEKKSKRKKLDRKLALNYELECLHAASIRRLIWYK